MTLNKRFFKYAFLNVLAASGVSLYLLADTFFISVAAGADGITALNMALPIYAVLYAIGAMLGMGSATRYAIRRAAGEKDVDYYFAGSVIICLVIGLLFALMGGIWPERVMVAMGADQQIVAVGRSYVRTFMLFSPFFVSANTFNAFVRNDGDPGLSMAGTLISSLFNIVMDYIFMFPLGMGMQGAALATAISPILNILICSAHFIKSTNNIRFVLHIPSIKRTISSCKLGVSAFIGEMSSGVTTAIFNFLLLSLGGNIAIAAYGVIANCALVGTAIFNGLSQGAQPLESECYGKADASGQRKVFDLAIKTAVALAVVIICLAFCFAPEIVAIFNTEGSVRMAELAERGMKIYFIGFAFSGLNILLCGYYSAINKAKEAFILALSRGLVAIGIFACILAKFVGIDGVWLSYPVAEVFTLIMGIWLGKRASASNGIV